MGVTKPAAGFAGVLRQREFRLLWLADIQSLLGDQIARVALSVLVFDRTHAGFATAAVYALTFLLAVVGTIALGPLADRLPRRALLVAGDGIRAALLATMAFHIYRFRCSPRCWSSLSWLEPPGKLRSRPWSLTSCPLPTPRWGLGSARRPVRRPNWPGSLQVVPPLR